MNNGFHVTDSIAQATIATGTGLVVTQQDHTTQIISVLVQIIALVGWFLKSRKTKNSEQ